MTRQCGACTLCCRLVPVEELDKAAGQRCTHQRAGKGCSIYQHRPVSCRFWNCQWLASDADLPRPDHGHFVVDTELDFITATNEETGEKFEIATIQVWVDPRYPDAHKDRRLRAWLEKMGDEKGLVAIIRYSSSEAFVLVPPSRSPTRQWQEQHATVNMGRDHSYVERMTTLNRIMTDGERRD